MEVNSSHGIMTVGDKEFTEVIKMHTHTNGWSDFQTGIVAKSLGFFGLASVASVILITLYNPLLNAGDKSTMFFAMITFYVAFAFTFFVYSTVDGGRWRSNTYQKAFNWIRNASFILAFIMVYRFVLACMLNVNIDSFVEYHFVQFLLGHHQFSVNAYNGAHSASFIKTVSAIYAGVFSLSYIVLDAVRKAKAM